MMKAVIIPEWIPSLKFEVITEKSRVV